MAGCTSQQHFDTQYGRTAFFSPRDVQFALYDKAMWRETKPFLKASRIITDLGAGGGTLLYNIAKITDAELIAVDFSSTVIPQLKEIVPRARILTENVTKTSLGTASCDFVVSTMTIEHVDDRAFIKECGRILSKGGHLLVTSVMKKQGARYFYKDKNGESVLEPSHLREYSSSEDLESLLENNGFCILRTATPRIKFPLLDPLIKFIFAGIGSYRWNRLLTSPIVEFLRLLTRVPIPGYYAIEIFARKE
jgi:2-polyprenyl-3-methyl-5-hydroxy-6-metoxy-1,4-benzoquinol methylase